MRQKNKFLLSKVPEYEGLCKPTKLYFSRIDLLFSPCPTGFFKLVKKHWLFGWIKTGKEFHGYISSKGEVLTTEGVYNYHQFK